MSREFITLREEVKRSKLMQDEDLARQTCSDQFRCSRLFFDRQQVSSSSPQRSSGAADDSRSLSILDEARALRQAEHEARLKFQQQRYNEDVHRSARLQLKRTKDAERARAKVEREQMLGVTLLERERAAGDVAGRNGYTGSLTPPHASRSPAPRSGRATASPLRVHQIKLRTVVSQAEAVAQRKHQDESRERRDLIERRRLENLERIRQAEVEARQEHARQEEEIELVAQVKVEALLMQQIDEKRHHFEKIDEMKALQREKERKKHQEAIALSNELNAAQRVIESSSSIAVHRGESSDSTLSPRRQRQLLQAKELELRRGLISAEIWTVQFNAASKKLEMEEKRLALEEKKRKGDEIRKKQVTNFTLLQEKERTALLQREEQYLHDLQQAQQAMVEQEVEQQKFVKHLKDHDKAVSAEMEAKKAALQHDIHLARQRSVSMLQDMSMEAREQVQARIQDAEEAHQKKIRSLEVLKLAELKAAQGRKNLQAREREQHAQELREREAAKLRHIQAVAELHEREKLNSHLFRQYVSEVKEAEVKKSEAFYLVKLPEKRPPAFRQAQQTPTNPAMLPPVVPPHPELHGFDFVSNALMRDINAELSAADAQVKSLRKSMRN